MRRDRRGLNSNSVPEPTGKEFYRGASHNMRRCREKGEEEGPNHKAHIGYIQGAE